MNMIEHMRYACDELYEVCDEHDQAHEVCL